MIKEIIVHLPKTDVSYKVGGRIGQGKPRVASITAVPENGTVNVVVVLEENGGTREHTAQAVSIVRA